MTEITYLHIAGTLEEDMVYSPLPGRESHRRGRPIQSDSAFQLLLLNAEDRILLSVDPEVKPAGCGTSDDPLLFVVRGSVPLHPSAAAYELRKGEILLYRADIPPEAPAPAEPSFRCSSSSLSLNWTVPNQPETYPIVDQAGSGAPDQTSQSCTSKLTYSITALMQSGRRLTLASRLTGTTHTIALSEVPAVGRGRLYLHTHDGVRSSEVEVGSIDVPSRPPTVHILKPEPFTRLPFGQPLSLLGCCLAIDGAPCSTEGISWWLNDRPFAFGNNIVALEGLPPGTHRLTLSYEGSDPAHSVRTSVDVSVEEPSEDYDLWKKLTSSL
jgi:hypothetical protein